MQGYILSLSTMGGFMTSATEKPVPTNLRERRREQTRKDLASAGLGVERDPRLAWLPYVRNLRLPTSVERSTAMWMQTRRRYCWSDASVKRGSKLPARR